jgi:hypothetical protein
MSERQHWEGLSLDCRYECCGWRVRDGDRLKVYSVNGESVKMGFTHDGKCPKDRRKTGERRVVGRRRP